MAQKLGSIVGANILMLMYSESNDLTGGMWELVGLASVVFGVQDLGCCINHLGCERNS